MISLLCGACGKDGSVAPDYPRGVALPECCGVPMALASDSMETFECARCQDQAIAVAKLASDAPRCCGVAMVSPSSGGAAVRYRRTVQVRDLERPTFLPTRRIPMTDTPKELTVASLLFEHARMGADPLPAPETRRVLLECEQCGSARYVYHHPDADLSPSMCCGLRMALRPESEPKMSNADQQCAQIEMQARKLTASIDLERGDHIVKGVIDIFGAGRASGDDFALHLPLLVEQLMIAYGVKGTES